MSRRAINPLLDYAAELRSLGIPLAQDSPELSAVIATYNRCPFQERDSLDHNPLAVTLASLLAQDNLTQVIVVDDGSTDSTCSVLEAFERRSPPGVLQVERLEAHAGSGVARNFGLRLARRSHVLILDDDMVLSSNFAAAAASQFSAIESAGHRIGAMTLPYYTRTGVPRAMVPAREIGALDLDQGYFTTNFDCVPDDALNLPPRTRSLLPPVKTTMASGFCIYSRAALTEVGGYPDLSGWPSAYSDQLVVAAELYSARWQVYHSPDPRLAAIHLRFGAAGRYADAELDGYRQAARLERTVPELLELASVARVNTGSRVAAPDFPAEMIGLFFSCYAVHSRTGGRAWARRTYADYVIGGTLYTTAYQPTVDREDRRAQWRVGLARGAIFAIRDKTPEVISQVNKQLEMACMDVGEPVIDLLLE